MSYMLPHLHNGWQVDQAILSEEDRVCVRETFTVCVFVFWSEIHCNNFQYIRFS